MLLDPIRSVVDFSFYKTLSRKSIGASVGYLAYLGLLYSVVVTATMYVNVRPLIAEAAEWVAVSAPPMTFAGGKLTSSLTQPMLLRHPKAPEAALIIDTNRTTPVAAGEMSDKKAFGYVTQNAIYWMAGDRMETYPLDKIETPKPVLIDGNYLRGVGESLNRWLYPVAFVGTWLMFLAWKHLAALAYSVLAMAFNAGLSAGLDYPALYKSAVYAQTPVVVLQMVTVVLPPPISFHSFFFLCLAVVCAYLWKAIRIQRDSAEPQAV